MGLGGCKAEERLGTARKSEPAGEVRELVARAPKALLVGLALAPEVEKVGVDGSGWWEAGREEVRWERRELGEREKVRRRELEKGDMFGSGRCE